MRKRRSPIRRCNKLSTKRQSLLYATILHLIRVGAFDSCKPWLFAWRCKYGLIYIFPLCARCVITTFERRTFSSHLLHVPRPCTSCQQRKSVSDLEENFHIRNATALATSLATKFSRLMSISFSLHRYFTRAIRLLALHLSEFDSQNSAQTQQ